MITLLVKQLLPSSPLAGTMLESLELLHGRQRSSWLLVSLKDGLDRKVLAFRNLMFALTLQKGSSILQTLKQTLGVSQHPQGFISLR